MHPLPILSLVIQAIGLVMVEAGAIADGKVLNGRYASLRNNKLPKRTSPVTLTEFDELQRAARLSSATYSRCNGSAFDVTITRQIDNAETDTQGYVGYSSRLQRITVVMRGSTTDKDFENDARTNLTDPVLSGVEFPPGAQVMEGLADTWGSVHDEVIAEVRNLIEQHPDYCLESAGHSLGGALTYLSYIALTQNFPEKNVVSNALAAFPIGNAAFADFGTSQKGLLRRGNNAFDGVPNIYVGDPENFVHYGVEFYGNGTVESTVRCEGQRDTECSAGNERVGITPEHVFSFGLRMGRVGCV